MENLSHSLPASREQAFVFQYTYDTKGILESAQRENFGGQFMFLCITQPSGLLERARLSSSQSQVRVNV